MSISEKFLAIKLELSKEEIIELMQLLLNNQNRSTMEILKQVESKIKVCA